MIIVNLIIAVIALIIAILAYQKAGGVKELRKQIDSISNLGESVASKAGSSVRDKTADMLGKMESSVRGTKEKKKEKETKK
ncbi:MAG: hypothetical protein U9R17_06275 [Thermodesulfobacteriota bacterium]|nr:hypothetical protein [Thermodesulfobacteriota bacterium]